MFNYQTVKIVAMTKPLLTKEGGTEFSVHEFVAYCARVSSAKNQDNHGTATRLVDYLMRNKHWSPLEMAHVTIEIITTRDIARQILRHRSFAFQEFSQRYSNEIEFVPPREARLQDDKNRQNSIETDDHILQVEWAERQVNLIGQIDRLYDWAMDKGMAKEQARVVLPEGLTQSKLYMAGSLRSWLHYLEIRTQEGVQKEHRDVALKCQGVLTEALPEFFKPQ